MAQAFVNSDTTGTMTYTLLGQPTFTYRYGSFVNREPCAGWYSDETRRHQSTHTGGHDVGVAQRRDLDQVGQRTFAVLGRQGACGDIVTRHQALRHRRETTFVEDPAQFSEIRCQTGNPAIPSRSGVRRSTRPAG